MTHAESPSPEPPHTELPHPVSLAQIGTLGMVREVAANAAECAAIAARLLIPAVGALSCRFQLMPAQGGMVMAQGTLLARVGALERAMDAVMRAQEAAMDAQEEEAVRRGGCCRCCTVM